MRKNFLYSRHILFALMCLFAFTGRAAVGDMFTEKVNGIDVDFTITSEGTKNTVLLGYSGTGAPAIPKTGVEYYDEDNELTYDEVLKLPDGYTTFSIPGFVKHNEIDYVVTSIGKRAFEGCTNVGASIELPSTIVSIQDRAFANSDITSITIPNSVTEIGQEAFASRTLTTFNIPSSVTKIGYHAFGDNYGSFWNNQADGPVYKDNWLLGYKGTVPSKIVIASGTKGIAKNALSSFNGSLSALTSLTIPSSVTYMEDPVYGGYNLTYLYSQVEQPVVLGEYWFNGLSSSCILIVPTGKTQEYASKGWTTEVFKGGVREPAIVTANDLTREYGESNPAFTYVVSGGPLSGYPNFSCSANTTSNVGDYTISISKGTLDENIPCQLVNGTFTITKATLMARAKSYTIKEGDPLPTFEVEYSGFKNNETSSVLSKQPSISCSATSLSSPGTYDIIVSGAEANNYNIAHVSGTLTITQSNYAIGETFTSVIAGTTMTFKVTGTNPKTCQVGTGDYMASSITNAFNGSLTIPTSVNGFFVTSLGDYAFYNCSSLSSVTIPNNVTSIGNWAFQGCTSLSSISFPSTITSIGGAAFAYCPIQTISIPSGVTTISQALFSHCTSLQTISIPEGVTKIEHSVFEGCTSLTSVTIPSTVTEIDMAYPLFKNCSSLSSISVSSGNTVYDSRNSCNAVIKKSNSELIIGTKSTVIPSSVSSIGAYAFAYSSITSVSIPASISTINFTAFEGSTNITDVTVASKNPISVASGTFPSCSNANLHVPYGSGSLYQSATGWKDFGHILEPEPYALTHGQTYANNSDSDQEVITYTRNFPTSRVAWLPWYVPFDLELTSDLLSKYSYAKFAGTWTDEDAGTFYIAVVKMKAGDVVKANTPYFVKINAISSDPQVFTVTNTTLYSAVENGFDMYSAEKKVSIQGNYSQKKATASDCDWYFVNSTGYVKVSSGQTLGGFNFYMTITDRADNPYASSPNPNNIKIRVLGEDGETVIEEIGVSDASANSNDVFDLAGRRIEREKAMNGIYIINGKKVLVK